MDKTKSAPLTQRHCEHHSCKRPRVGRELCSTHYMQKRRAAIAAANPRAPEPDLPGETWRSIPGYEGQYEASDLGRVRSIERTITDALGRSRRLKSRILRAAVCKRNGRITHMSVLLGARNPYQVHQLIMRAFAGPRPSGLEVCHNNGDPTDNRLENLRYDTRSSNHLDKQRHGTDVYRNRTHCPRNHPLAEPNLKPSALKRGGHRECLACSRAKNKVYYNASIHGVSIDFQATADWYYQQIAQDA